MSAEDISQVHANIDTLRDDLKRASTLLDQFDTDEPLATANEDNFVQLPPDYINTSSSSIVNGTHCFKCDAKTGTKQNTCTICGTHKD